MIYEERKPASALAAVVKCFWSLEAEGDPHASFEPVLPDGCPEIVFNLADRFQRGADKGTETQPATIVSGQISSHILIRPTGRVSLFGVRFQPSGAYSFLRIPIGELLDQVISLDSILGRFAHDLEERVFESGSLSARIAALEKAILSRETPSAIGRDVARGLVECLVSGERDLSVRRLADRIGRTERTVERIFKTHVGISPKSFAGIARFQRLIRYFETSPRVDLSDAAVAFGYYDQPHMTREFKRLAGVSPTAFLIDTHPISELFTATA